jgi:cytochrome c oxidase cbb3-type subunit 3
MSEGDRHTPDAPDAVSHDVNAAGDDEPQDRVLHTYDGIEEYDNRLPLWWQYTLYGAIAFALVYWFDFQVLKSQPGPKREYEAAMQVVHEAEAKRALEQGEITPEVLITLSKDQSSVARGQQIFAQTCAPCHRADGAGNVGPNLTDEFWIHGSGPLDVFKTVRDGVPAKGMPTWGPQLGQDKTAAAVAFVLTIANTNVPGGKPPQGERVK